jgi:ribonuclease E
VNSGRATKEGSIEETALKTNLEASEEVARQVRLRDLAGLIVIDFIDMEERRNNNAVEKRLKEKLKTDRARIQVGRISGFGLLEMSRQRLRPGMLEITTQPCAHCHGTGLIRSDNSLALSILRALEEEGVRKRAKEVLVKAPVGVINYLFNEKREHLALIEARYGLSLRLEGDAALVGSDFSIERFKTATRVLPPSNGDVISIDTSSIEVEEAQVVETAEEETAEEEAQPKKRRRRRRRRKGGGSGSDEGSAESSAEDTVSEAVAEAETAPAEAGSEPAETQEAEEKPKRRRRRRKKTESDTSELTGAETGQAEVKSDETPTTETVMPVEVIENEPVEVASEPEAEPEAASAQEEPTEQPSSEPEPAAAEVAETVEVVDEPARPKRRGWWSRGS